MNRTLKKTHSLIRNLNRDYLVLSLLPVIAFFILTLAGAYLAKNYVANLIDGSMQRLEADIETRTVQDGERLIQNQAREVAKQIELIIGWRPWLTIEQFQQSYVVGQIAQQRVGLTGYTCLYEAGSGVMRFHPNAELVNRRMEYLAEKVPSFWETFAPSLAGVEASGYYDWLEEDGRITHKYMAMTPIKAQLDGRTLMIAATIYMDEFLAPVRFTEERAGSIAGEYRAYVSRQTLLIGGGMLAVLVMTLYVVFRLSRRSAARFVLPIRQLADTATQFGREVTAGGEPSPMLERRDEIGELARAFNRMRFQIVEQFRQIKKSYEKLWETQQALSESEANYRSLFENVPIGIYRSEPGGRILDANPALVKMFGYPDKESLLLRPAPEFYVKPQDRESFEEMADGHWSGKWCEYQMRRRDGSVIWVEEQGVAVRDGASNILYYEGTLKDITERKLAEEALRESEANFRMVVENSPVAIFCHTGGRFLYLNPAALKLFGADAPDEIVGRSVFAHIHPDSIELSRERRRILVEEKKPVPEAERVYLKMDGTPVTVEARAVPLKFRGENAVLALAQNVTKRKLAQEALRLSEQRFRTAFENASVGMCLVGLDGVFIEVNAALASMIGRDPDELVGKPVTVFTHADDIDRRRQFVDDLAAGKLADGQQERRFTHRNGSVVWTLISANLQKDQTGRPLHFISLVQNISERKKAEEELQLARFCIDHAAVAIFRVADDARILEVNEHACRSLGYSRRELLAMRVFDINPVVVPEEWFELRRTLPDAGIRVYESQHRRKDGTCFPVEVTSNFTKKGDQGLSYAFVTDISGRITAERDRERLEAQLRQAQKMEAIGTLAGGIAHDFNNILSIIIGNANILEISDGLPEADRSCLQQILAAVERARQLVQQILTFSRRGEQQRLLVNLKPVVKETFNFLKATLPSSIEVHQNLRADAGAVILADPTQMQQVLMNLCTNAAHAMENRENGRLEIGLEKAVLTEEQARFEPDVAPGEFVKLTVADNGPGILPWVRERMFEPYFTTKGPGKGTGLGLSVVHGIIKDHGGFIKVYSEPGKGTSFHVFFPVAEGEGQSAAPRDTKLPRGSETLLLVDDDKTLVDMTRQMLERLGYRVETRTSPLEAIEAFRAHPDRYQAVVTDMTMPQMNGINLSKKLLEIRADLPILLCTGFSDAANEVKARAAGIREFAFKPLALRDFAETLRKMLDEAKTTADVIDNSEAIN